MKFSEFLYLLKSDLYRYEGSLGARAFLANILQCPGFRYVFIMRLSAYLYGNKLWRITLAPISSFLHHHYTIKYGISISRDTTIGRGFYIGHFGGIVVSTQAVIGKNCNISHDVTIGQVNRGFRKGTPIIGNNVYIAPGAKIIGRIVIGNNVAIGANCVVTKDIPNNAVVVGVPGKVISYSGSDDYINRVLNESPSYL